MKGYIGTDAVLAPGTVIITGHNRELRLVVVGEATEADARAAWAAQGIGEIRVVPGERFYEIEQSTTPVGSAN